jgi:hypothetical protein
MILAVIVAASFAGARAADDPASVVKALYKDHFAHEQRWDLTVKNHRDAFAPALLALIDEDDRRAAGNPDEIVGLDFNPITNMQEEATGYEVGAATKDGADAIVPVTVRIGSESQVIRVRLIQIDGAWRVANLHYSEGDLVGILKELAAP